MKLEYNIRKVRLAQIADWSARLEQAGWDGIGSPEADHNPFFPLQIAAASTKHLALATSVAIAFARSPMLLAQTAWDLQQLSGGRFELGLGSQVKGHITRRFSMPWSPPAPRMREYVLALRAIWSTFQTGAPLKFAGRHYTFDLMTPWFNPGPIASPAIPISIAAVNRGMCTLAGEICDGVRLHSFHSPAFLTDVMLPSIAAGAARAGRDLSTVNVGSSALVVAGATKAAVHENARPVKRQLAFYASTRTYRAVMDSVGLGALAEQLHELSLQGKWEEMTGLITDEVLKEFAIVGTYDAVAEEMVKRYAGRVNTLSINLNPDEACSAAWQQILRDVHSGVNSTAEATA